MSWRQQVAGENIFGVFRSIEEFVTFLNFFSKLFLSKTLHTSGTIILLSLFWTNAFVTVCYTESVLAGPIENNERGPASTVWGEMCFEFDI